MKNIAFGVSAAGLILIVMSCGWRTNENGNRAGTELPNSTPTPTPTPKSVDPASNGKRAYRIEGTIDDANQVGNVCDTSVEFTVPGTLEFKFTPTDATKGNYTYSGPFNATGSGPYVINEDGTMIVDGTGCIMGRCATYSHKWKAKRIDAATCKPDK